MSTYTVIQDIEAEDKLLGPLSLRQFIYAVIVVILGYVIFRLFFVQPFLTLPLLPVILLFGVLAAPFGHDQSSEIWLLAKIRFILKPRVRIWNQAGLQELVKITVPKHIEQILTNNLDENQVKSRLQALAQTIDSRGWAVKGVNVNLSQSPNYSNLNTDRLVSASSLNPSDVPDYDIKVSDDILDMTNNPVAQQMTQMVQANDQNHRQAALHKMEEIRSTGLPQSVSVVTPSPMTVSYSQPTAPPTHTISRPSPTVTATPSPAIMQLASNDDLSVATIARQANKASNLGDDEVVISLR